MTAGRNNSDALSTDWGTPEKYVVAVKQVFGGKIDLDPCSNRWSIVKALTSWKLPDNDGLVGAWDFPTIYVNPPYGSDKVRGTRIRDWLRKCVHAHDEFDSDVIALVPVAANTGHWKESVWGKAQRICFLYDTRLRFLENGEDTGKGSPMACAAIYWGSNPERFSSVFSAHGAVVNLTDIRTPVKKSERQLTLIRADHQSFRKKAM